MPEQSVDLEKLRFELRHLDRGRLLIVAERAVERLPRAALDAVVEGMIKIPPQIARDGGADSLLAETRKFYEASMRGEYFQSFDVNSKNCTEKSPGTDAFIAEFDRLMGKCVQAVLAVTAGAPEPAREPFEILFSLLHQIDEDPDRVVFFADEAGSWQVPVDWGTVLPAYFRCLAATAKSEEFAREVDRVIRGFCHYQRPELLKTAWEIADDEQKMALARLPRLLSVRTQT